MKHDMRRFIARNKKLLAITAILMAGSGCVSAVRETNKQLTEDAMKPITVPVEGYLRAKDVAGDVNDSQEEKQRQLEELGE